MRAAINERFGGPEVLEVRDIAEPHARAGQLRVRVTAAGLNPMDWMFIADDELGHRLRAARAAQPGLALILPAVFGWSLLWLPVLLSTCSIGAATVARHGNRSG